MYNAWLDLFIKLPCFGLFREGQREGAAWEAAAFCKGLFNYLPGDWLHGHPVHLGDAPRVRVRGGGQPKGQSQSPGPRLAWGSGRRTPLRSKRGVDRRLGRAPFCRCRRGGGGVRPHPPRAPVLLASLPDPRLGTAGFWRSHGGTPGLCSVSLPGNPFPWGGPCPTPSLILP